MEAITHVSRDKPSSNQVCLQHDVMHFHYVEKIPVAIKYNTQNGATHFSVDFALFLSVSGIVKLHPSI